MCTNVSYFHLSEFTKTQTGLFNEPTTPRIMANIVSLWDFLVSIHLDSIREKLQYPIVINSAFRSPEVNKQIGGAKRSLHMQGRAADICTVPLEMDRLWSILKEEEDNLSELIHYGTFIHVAL